MKTLWHFLCKKKDFPKVKDQSAAQLKRSLVVEFMFGGIISITRLVNLPWCFIYLKEPPMTALLQILMKSGYSVMLPISSFQEALIETSARRDRETNKIVWRLSKIMRLITSAHGIVDRSAILFRIDTGEWKIIARRFIKVKLINNQRTEVFQGITGMQTLERCNFVFLEYWIKMFIDKFCVSFWRRLKIKKFCLQLFVRVQNLDLIFLQQFQALKQGKSSIRLYLLLSLWHSWKGYCSALARALNIACTSCLLRMHFYHENLY